MVYYAPVTADDPNDSLASLHHRLTLADRLGRLGLTRLADQVLGHAMRLFPDAPEAARQRARLRLSVGEAEAALEIAQGISQEAPEAATSLVQGEAALAAGRFEKATWSLTRVEKQEGAAPEEVGRALVGLARVALRRGNPMEAATLLCQAADGQPLLPAVARRIGDVAGALSTWPRVQKHVEALRRRRPEDASMHYLLARLLAAAQRGAEPGIPSQEIERLLNLSLERDQGCHLARLMLSLRQARRRFLSDDGRGQALRHLRFLSQALRLNPEALGVDAGLIDLVIAALLDETPATAAQAVDFYLAGLRRLPAHAVASTNLGVLYLGRGEVASARQRLLAALAASPDYAPAYHHLVRTLDLTASPEQIAHEVETLVAALPAPPTAVTGRIVAAMAEDARDQVFEALHGKATQLHTLLGVIHARLYAMLRDGEAPGPVRERLTELAERLEEVRRDWRLYLRSLHGGEEWSPEVLSLNLLSAEVIRDETGNDGRVELRMAAALPDVKGQRASLYEAIAAVVRNGLEAQPPACPPLEVRTLSGAPQPTCAMLEVRDFGPGFSALGRARLFVPGFSTKRDQRGFGLSLARRIVTAHRGWLVVEAAPDVGTLVRMVLPADLHGLPALLDEPLQLTPEELEGQEP